MHFGEGRDSTCVPLKWLAISISEFAAMIWMSGLAHAASAPLAAGQIRPSSRALAPIAAGNTPATGAIDPSRPSSPSTVKPDKRIRRNGADRRHQPERDRQIVMAAFLRQIGGREIDGDAAGGSASPEAISAERTRSRASDTALSGRPTIAKAGSPGATCTCTSTARASIPSKATVETR